MSLDKIKPPFASYNGSGSYAFICYAHDNAKEVYPAISWLRDQGLNIWYDEGISPGQQWRDELANAIDNCSVFIIFVSPDSVGSLHCRKEINYAIERTKVTLSIHLRETELPPGLALAMSDMQALMKFQLAPDEFKRKLLGAVSGIIEPASHAGATPTIARPAPGDAVSKKLRTFTLGGIAAAVLVAVVGIGYSNNWGVDQPLTIAVLPFDNFTSDATNDYIAAGIAEEVINLLEKVQSLNVVGRTASFYFKGKDVDFFTIADRLEADMLLEGSLQRENNRIRISAQLVDGETGIHEWSDVFEEDVDNIMVVQQQIAIQVAAALEAVLSQEEIEELERSPTQDSEAFALYLEARSYLRIASTRADLENARNLFQQAIDRDAKFVEAQSGLCETELARYQRTSDDSDYARASAVCVRLASGEQKVPEALIALGTLNRLVGNYSEALELFDSALAEDSELEPAYYGRARALQGLGRLEEAEAALRTSVALEPGYWQVYSGYGVFLAMTGRLEEAVEQLRKVVDLTPENPQGHGNLGTALFTLGRWEEAEQAWTHSLALEASSHSYENLGTALYHKGDYLAAANTFQDGTERFPETFRLWGKLGSARAALGDPEAEAEAIRKAIELAEPLRQVNPDDGFVLSHLCVYYVRIGDLDRGLPLCDRSVELAPNDPELHYMRATALRLAEQTPASDEALAVAMALGYSDKVLTSDPVFKNP